MPIYPMVCTLCQHAHEQFRDIKADAEPCPKCKGDCRLDYSALNIKTERVFHGSTAVSQRWEFHPDEVDDARKTPELAASGARIMDDGRVAFDKRSDERKFANAMHTLETRAYGTPEPRPNMKRRAENKAKNEARRKGERFKFKSLGKVVVED